VIGGMAVNAYFWGPGAKLWKTNPVWFTNRVEHSGLFWHFVDLVWIFLFPTLVSSVGASMTSDHAATHATSDHAVDIDKHVRIYITVFVALMVLTIVTVAVSRFHLPCRLP
jgi:hypothetical protein